MCSEGFEDDAAEAAGLPGGGRRLGFCFLWVLVHCHWFSCDVSPCVQRQKCCASFPTRCLQKAGSPCNSSELWGRSLVAYQQQCWWCPGAVHHKQITWGVWPSFYSKSICQLYGISCLAFHSSPGVQRSWGFLRLQGTGGPPERGWKQRAVIWGQVCGNNYLL